MTFHPDLVGALEPEQLTAAKERPLPRRKLGPGVSGLLILLRVYVLVVIPIVAYAFVRAVLAQAG